MSWEIIRFCVIRGTVRVELSYKGSYKRIVVSTRFSLLLLLLF